MWSQQLDRLSGGTPAKALVESFYAPYVAASPAAAAATQTQQLLDSVAAKAGTAGAASNQSLLLLRAFLQFGHKPAFPHVRISDELISWLCADNDGAEANKGARGTALSIFAMLLKSNFQVKSSSTSFRPLADSVCSTLKFVAERLAKNNNGNELTQLYILMHQVIDVLDSAVNVAAIRGKSCGPEWLVASIQQSPDAALVPAASIVESLCRLACAAAETRVGESAAAANQRLQLQTDSFKAWAVVCDVWVSNELPLPAQASTPLPEVLALVSSLPQQLLTLVHKGAMVHDSFDAAFSASLQVLPSLQRLVATEEAGAGVRAALGGVLAQALAFMRGSESGEQLGDGGGGNIALDDELGVARIDLSARMLGSLLEHCDLLRPPSLSADLRATEKWEMQMGLDCADAMTKLYHRLVSITTAPSSGTAGGKIRAACSDLRKSLIRLTRVLIESTIGFVRNCPEECWHLAVKTLTTPLLFRAMFESISASKTQGSRLVQDRILPYLCTAFKRIHRYKLSEAETLVDSVRDLCAGDFVLLVSASADAPSSGTESGSGPGSGSGVGARLVRLLVEAYDVVPVLHARQREGPRMWKQLVLSCLQDVFSLAARHACRLPRAACRQFLASAEHDWALLSSALGQVQWQLVEQVVSEPAAAAAAAVPAVSSARHRAFVRTAKRNAKVAFHTSDEESLTALQQALATAIWALMPVPGCLETETGTEAQTNPDSDIDAEAAAVKTSPPAHSLRLLAARLSYTAGREISTQDEMALSCTEAELFSRIVVVLSWHWHQQQQDGPSADAASAFLEAFVVPSARVLARMCAGCVAPLGLRQRPIGQSEMVREAAREALMQMVQGLCASPYQSEGHTRRAIRSSWEGGDMPPEVGAKDSPAAAEALSMLHRAAPLPLDPIITAQSVSNMEGTVVAILRSTATVAMARP